MNYKRKKPSNRKIRRCHGCIGLGKDGIRRQIDKDHLENVLESVDKYSFQKKIL